MDSTDVHNNPLNHGDPLGLSESVGETVFGKDTVEKVKKAVEASTAWDKARDFFKNNQSGRAVADLAKPLVLGRGKGVIGDGASLAKPEHRSFGRAVVLLKMLTGA